MIILSTVFTIVSLLLSVVVGMLSINPFIAFAALLSMSLMMDKLRSQFEKVVCDGR